MKHRTLTPSGFGWELESYDPDTIRTLPRAFHSGRPSAASMALRRFFSEAAAARLVHLVCRDTARRPARPALSASTAAYDALPADTKTRIDGLTTTHSYRYLDEYLRRANPHRPPLSDELRAQHPPIERPLVAGHPETGRKALYIPKCQIESVDGLSPHDAETLLAELLEHATGPDFAFMHRWLPGDIVVWDNRSTLHAPSPFDDAKYDRLLYRLTMSGEQIV